MSIIKNKKIRVIFMGTPEFAGPGLETLAQAKELGLVAVFTQRDKAVGRKQILTEPAVKKIAKKYNIPVFQPRKIKDDLEIIKELKPDLIVIIAYGQIIPPEILSVPTYSCLNVHASLLPKYRGAACLNAPILNGDKETGVTIMQIDAGLDTGPILRQAKIKLSDEDNLETVHDKLSQLGASILVESILAYIKGELKPQKQNNKEASYVKTINKKDGIINWDNRVEQIERLIRAYNPWPGSYTFVANDRILKIKEAKIENKTKKEYPIGKLFTKNNKLLVQCGQGQLLILKLQLAGAKELNDQEFIRGYQSLLNQILK